MNADQVSTVLATLFAAVSAVAGLIAVLQIRRQAEQERVERRISALWDALEMVRGMEGAGSVRAIRNRQPRLISAIRRSGHRLKRTELLTSLPASSSLTPDSLAAALSEIDEALRLESGE